MNTPPIASPFGEPKKQVQFTGRLQWDGSSGCLRLDYSTPFSAHIRFLFQSIRFQPARIIQLPFYPLVFVLLLLFHYMRTSVRLVSTQIFEWGICDVTPEKTTRIAWWQIKKAVDCNGDIFLFRGMGDSVYIPREAFANQDEGQRFLQIIQRLSQTPGASWRDVSSIFPG